jgi:predicted phage terminase large subunit-like protein
MNNDILGTVASPSFAIAVNAEICRRDLYEFAKGSWSVLEPASDFIDNWHIGEICKHLQAVTEGKIRRLIINIPPRFMKSLLVSVIWPAWEWASCPSRRWLSSSYAQNLAERDAVKMRTLIDSPWYQQRYGHVFNFKADQNAKSRFENDKTGFRVSTSPGGMGTGEGGDRLTADDPHNVKQAESDTTRETTLTWWDETMSSRYNNPKTGTAVIVMQRVHESDLTGHLLAKGGWEHLCIPMEYDGVRRSTSLGEYDPRTVEGELLWPDRFGVDEVEALKKALGSYATACQLQQRPSPRGGGIFQRKDFRYYKILPTLDEIIISADCTFKDLKTSDNVAIQAWGTSGPNKYLLHRIKEKLGFSATCTAIESMIAKFPKHIAILIEDKANGSAVIEVLSQKFPRIIAVNPEGGKVARAYAMQPEHEAGNIYIPDPSIEPTIEDYIHEHCGFPNAAYDDEVDATTQCINWLRTRCKTNGFIEFMARQVAEKNSKQLATH